MQADSEDNVKYPMIYARERGPGPGIYGLPPCLGYQEHDPTKKVLPAHSFGKKLKSSLFKKDCSPGPRYLVDYQYTRFGKDGTPSYSMLGKNKIISSFKTPSPCDYSPETAHPQGEALAPSYSMGSRTRYRKWDSTPSSNSYSLPNQLGTNVPVKNASAAYTMTGRSYTGGFAEDFAKTPGPGAYDMVRPSTYTRNAPAYSMQGRSTIPGDGTKKPGPGTHCPERVTVTKPSPPHFSMGIKHSEYTTPLILEVGE